jgi:hypothetical protein
MGSSHRHAAAAVRRVQQRLKRLAIRVLASLAPEGAGGHEAAGRKSRCYDNGCGGCRVLPRSYKKTGDLRKIGTTVVETVGGAGQCGDDGV